MPFGWICDRKWRRMISSKSALLAGIILYFFVTKVLFVQRQLRNSSDLNQNDNTSWPVGSQQQRPSDFPPPQTVTIPGNGTAKKPKLVLLVSYQRTGSSFIGNLFNQNPGAFYAFEPLDGLYVSMYGTAPGYNVPSDITTFWNGTQRPMPAWENRAIVDALDALLNCQHLDSLPTEMLLHDFWNGYKYDHRNIGKFLQCLRDSRATSIGTLCLTESSKVQITCGHWFGQRVKAFEICPKNLWPFANRTRTDRTFAAYVSCIDRQRPTVKKCVPFMEEVCRKSLLRATKVVRPTMQSIPDLMKKYPDSLKILHLFRRPHSVVKSRQKFSSVHGHSSPSQDMAKEARLYCREAVKDIKLRKTLEEKYPRSFKQLIYEEFVANQSGIVKEIYDFLEEPLPEEVMAFFKNQTFTPDKKSGWLIPETGGAINDIIDKECQELYKELEYSWKKHGSNDKGVLPLSSKQK